MKRLLTITALTVLAVVGQAQTISQADKDQITEVTLERTACYGTCPEYKVTLRRDGTVIYEGRRFVEKLGTYKGTAYGFNRLAELILKEHYFDLKDDYSRLITDMPSAITSAVRGGNRKTIRNYADSGPVELWGIETVIDGILKYVQLEKVAVRPVRPRHR